MSGSQPLSQEEVRNIWSNIVEYVRRYNLDENNIDLRNYVGEARLINPEVAEMTRSLFIKHGMIPGSSQIESFLQSLIDQGLAVRAAGKASFVAAIKGLQS